MGSGDVPNESKLSNCPTDGISAVKFAPTTAQFLLASSWDCTVRLYDVVENTQRFKYSHPTPVLDCCFSVSPSQAEDLLVIAVSRFLLIDFHICRMQRTRGVADWTAL